MVGTGKQGDGNVVDLDAFRRHSEDRKLRELFGPDPLPLAGDATDQGRDDAPDDGPREQVGGLVVEVGLDVWPGTSPLDGLVARADDRDHGLIAECRNAALADEDESLDLDDMKHGTTVLRAFLTRLGDRGLPLAGPGPLSEYAVALIMLDIDPIGTWKGETAAASPQHPVRRVRSAATAMGLVRTEGPALVVTRRGAQLRDSPAALWDHVAGCLPLERTPGGREAALLVLLLTAAGRATLDRSFGDTIDSVGARLRLNSPEPDHRPRNTLTEAARTVDVLNWAGHARIGGLDTDPPSFPPWAGLHWGPACQLARAAVARLV
ncbi:hypothetical protein ACFDTO_11690 [Microbacteriaceae bacterium 4G12]